MAKAPHRQTEDGHTIPREVHPRRASTQRDEGRKAKNLRTFSLLSVDRVLVEVVVDAEVVLIAVGEIAMAAAL
jgi:hypothetical protein